MKMVNFRYKPPESSASDKRTPVTFHDKRSAGFIPGEESLGEELFFCMAEMYGSSIKDYEALDTTNLEFAMTLIIPNPAPDYKPKLKHEFIVEDPLYDEVIFNIQSFEPNGIAELKIVGAAYG